MSLDAAERNYWTDIWRFRELFYFLAWRDILVRYKQTVVGVAWAVLRPFLTMVIFTVVFSRVAKLHSEGAVPYALLVMAGMLPWQFISASLASSSDSVLINSNLISKIYFPRLIIPSSSIVTSFVDFVITLVLMAVMMAWYRFVPDWHLLALPLFILLALGCALGLGFWLAALTVEYRDVRCHVVPVHSSTRDCTFLRSDSSSGCCNRKNGACFTPSIRLWESSTDSAGRFCVRQCTFHGRAFWRQWE